MARRDIKPPKKALLISGLIFKKGLDLHEILLEISKNFSEIMDVSEIVPFSWTYYYEREMGKGLLRCFLSFKGLVDQDELPDIKHVSMDIEEKWSIEGKRTINIDPGILTAERLVLATTKNYTHRIYLRNGIYADLSLIYQNKSFKELPWTYPDYRSDLCIDFLMKARKKYLSMLKGRDLGTSD